MMAFLFEEAGVAMPVAKKAPAAKKPIPAAKKSVPAKTTHTKPVSSKPVATPSTAKKVPATKVTAAVKAPAPKAQPAPVAKKAAPAKKPTQPTMKTAVKPSRSTPAKDIASFTNFEPYKEQRGEEYMNDPQNAHFRGILLAWKRELMEEVDRTLHHMQEEAENYADPNDRASQESDFTLELRARDRERKLIKKIDEAINKLEQGEYGYCDSCGIEIGVRRLEARPTATLCIDCKTLDEIREKQRGG